MPTPPDSASITLDATAQAELIRSKQLSPGELVGSAIGRAAAVNPMINAIIHERYGRAMAEADDPNLPDGPFRGVPIVVKDLGLMMKGEPFHLGSRSLRDARYVAPCNSYLYEKFRAAGFVVIGRTNTPELGTTITTEPLAYGPTRNPWNLGHSTGGSSGGSAAAVAAGIVAVGHANDGGGSIRIPASECGLVGLKPTRARVSKGPQVGEEWMGATIDHVVATTVRDAANILDVLHGAMPGDPYAAPTPTRAFGLEPGTPPGRLRVGVFAGAQEGRTVHPECVAAVEKAARLLSSLGHHLTDDVPAAFVDPHFGDRFTVVLVSSVATDVAGIEEILGRPVTEDDIEPENLLFTHLGRSVSATAYLEAVAWMHGYQRRMAQWWAPIQHGGSGFDLLLTPTIATPPPRIGWLADPAAAHEQRVLQLLQYTAQCNITGQPAISLPLHVTSGGLPVGVQLVAGYGREDILLRVAAQIEAASPWPLLAPPIAD